VAELLTLNNILPVPKLSVLVLLLLLAKPYTVNVKVLNANVHAVSVKPSVFGAVNAEPNVIVLPAALIVIALPILQPLVVTVELPRSVIAPDMLQTVPASNEILP
jgi:hypothetical protein